LDVPWAISGQVEPHSRPGVDAEGWLWEIRRGDEARRLLVEISRTARAVDEQTLPGDTAAAVKTEGHSQVVEVLQLDDPPRVILCGTDGCRPRTQDELSG
jgi:hypothetical protein